MLVACGSANASYLTDDSDRAGAMTRFAGSPGGTAGNSGADAVDFTTASQTKIDFKQGIAPGEFIRLQGVVQHVGNNMYAMPQFVEYLQACIRNYKPGMQLNAQEVQITEEDILKVQHLRQFIAENLFETGFDQRIVPSEPFKEFTQSEKLILDKVSCKGNSLMLALMYFFDHNEGPVSIKNQRSSYGGLDFQWLPCSDEDKNSGTAMEFSFERSNFNGAFSEGLPITSSGKYGPGSTVEDHLVRYSFYGGSKIASAYYTFGLFKIKDGRFRMNVKLAATSSRNGDIAEAKDQKITNFLVKL